MTAAGDRILIAYAQRLLDTPERATVSAWARAAALLTRQALERGLRDALEARLPGAGRLSMRSQLNCASILLGRAIAGEISYTWSALSQATHHRPYELDPTREELASLTAATSRIITCLESMNEAAVSEASP